MSVDDRRRSSHRVATVVPSISRERFRTCVFIGFESTRRSKQGSWFPLFSTLQLQKVRPDKIREFFSQMMTVCAHPRAAVKYRAVELLLFVCSPAAELPRPGRPKDLPQLPHGPTQTTPRTYPNYPSKYNEGKKTREGKSEPRHVPPLLSHRHPNRSPLYRMCVRPRDHTELSCTEP